MRPTSGTRACVPSSWACCRWRSVRRWVPPGRAGYLPGACCLRRCSAAVWGAAGLAAGLLGFAPGGSSSRGRARPPPASSPAPPLPQRGAAAAVGAAPARRARCGPAAAPGVALAAGAPCGDVAVRRCRRAPPSLPSASLLLSLPLLPAAPQRRSASPPPLPSEPVSERASESHGARRSSGLRPPPPTPAPCPATADGLCVPPARSCRPAEPAGA